MTNQTFRTIVADPPWPYKTPGQIGKTLEHRPNRDKTFASRAGAGSVVRYGAMSIVDLCALDVPADDNAHLGKYALYIGEESAHYSLDRPVLARETRHE